MHFAEIPHTQTLLRHRLDNTSPPHAAEVPHLQTAGDTLPSHVSVVRVHAGLQSAEIIKEEVNKSRAETLSSDLSNGKYMTHRHMFHQNILHH